MKSWNGGGGLYPERLFVYGTQAISPLGLKNEETNTITTEIMNSHKFPDLLVCSEVAVESVGVGESPAADEAGLEILPRVSSHVILQLLLFREHHAAHLTRLAFFALKDSEHLSFFRPCFYCMNFLLSLGTSSNKQKIKFSYKVPFLSYVGG